jgi:hypothetical protein
MRGGRLAVGVAVLAAAACAELATAPGQCPTFCPSGRIRVADTLLVTNVGRDSAFRGYVSANASSVMLAANLTGLVDGRPIFRFVGIGPRLVVKSGDTTTGPIVGADSARLTLIIIRRDTATHNLALQLYRMPSTIDSNATFAGVSGPFTDSLVRRVNIDSLIAKPGKKDSVTGDSAIVDTTTGHITLSLKLDSTAIRYLPADTGKVAYGIRITADTLATIAIGKGSFGPTLLWHLRFDSSNVIVKRTPVTGLPTGLPTFFSSFVFSPPAPPTDSTLAVGGVPSARSFLRIAIPRAIRESTSIIRGTLILVPAVAARGSAADSFFISARTVLADFGAKSPVFVADSDTTTIHIGKTDTVRIEVTNLLQYWAADTTRPTTIVLTALPEAAGFSEVRFYPSRAAAYRPSLHVTYLQRYPFGSP